MNAGLQALYAIKELRKYILNTEGQNISRETHEFVLPNGIRQDKYSETSIIKKIFCRKV
jgi:hypothetical protein